MKITTLIFTIFSLTSFSQENYKFIDSAKKYFGKDFIKYFKPAKQGVVFFYPNEDISKKVAFEDQIKEIAKEERFKNFKIIGISYKPGVKDADNVYFENHLITNTECFIYSTDSLIIDRALNNDGNFSKINKKSPADFYQIDINKDGICVKEKRIQFCRTFILDVTSPILSEKEKVLELQLKLKEVLTTINLLNDRLTQVEQDQKLQNEKITNLETEIKQLKLTVEYKKVKPSSTPSSKEQSNKENIPKPEIIKPTN